MQSVLWTMKFFVAEFLLLFCLTSSVHGTIKSTSIIFRHGQRTPTSDIGMVLPSETISEIGLGKLTKFGVRQLFANGQFLRERYLHLFPKDGYFRDDNMQIMSSGYSRTIMSLQSFMAGFFPPPKTEMNLPIPWQPFEFEVDYDSKYLKYEFDRCPRYHEAHKDSLANLPPKTAELFKKEKKLLDKYSEKFGFNLQDPWTVINVADYVNSLVLLNDPLPAWAKEAYDQWLFQFTGLYEIYFHTDFMRKVRTGAVLAQIVENMEAVQNKTEKAKNFMIYSGHDLTLVGLGEILKVTEQLPVPIPNYADTMMFDLLDNGGGELEVQSVYIDNSGSTPNQFVLNVPGCGEKCPLSKFRALVEYFMVHDWEGLCAL